MFRKLGKLEISTYNCPNVEQMKADK